MWAIVYIALGFTLPLNSGSAFYVAMRRLFFLCLLLSTALAASALSVDDFELKPTPNPITFSEGQERTVSVRIDLLNPQYNAFNVSVEIGSVPDGLELLSEDIVTVDGLVNVGFYGIVEFVLNANNANTFDLSNAFEVASWDDSVSLNLDSISEEVTDRSLTISGTTDSAALCAAHNYRGVWNEEKNCNVAITVNGQEMGYADKEGYFKFNIDLEEGNNEIIIKAMDPGGNSVEETHPVRFTQSIVNRVKDYIVYIGGFFALVFAVIIFRIIRRAKSVEKHVGIVSQQVTETGSRVDRVKDETRQDTLRQITVNKINDIIKGQKDLVNKEARERYSNNRLKINEISEKLKDNVRQHVETDPRLQGFVSQFVASFRQQGFTAKQVNESLQSPDFETAVKQAVNQIVPLAEYGKTNWQVAQEITSFYQGFLRDAVLRNFK